MSNQYNDVTLRLAVDDDFNAIWTFFKPIVRASETYAIDPDIQFAEAKKLWLELPRKTWVAEYNDEIIASYYLKDNFAGPANHICNCGHMVSPAARGKGVARQMCVHSQEQALAFGYQAMQFNLVVASNTVAVDLWQRLGFIILATLPQAYRHAQLGLVDAYVMHKFLSKNA